MFSKLWCARVCYAIFLGSNNATLHSKIEHTANHFTVIQTLRVSKSTFSLLEIILKVHIHLSMTHRVSRMQNQEIKNFSTTYPSPNVQGLKNSEEKVLDTFQCNTVIEKYKKIFEILMFL